MNCLACDSERLYERWVMDIVDISYFSFFIKNEVLECRDCGYRLATLEQTQRNYNRAKDYAKPHIIEKTAGDSDCLLIPHSKDDPNPPPSCS